MLQELGRKVDIVRGNGKRWEMEFRSGLGGDQTFDHVKQFANCIDVLA